MADARELAAGCGTRDSDQKELCGHRLSCTGYVKSSTILLCLCILLSPQPCSTQYRMRLINVAAILDVETSIKEGKEFSASTPVVEEFYGPDLAEKKLCYSIALLGERRKKSEGAPVTRRYGRGSTPCCIDKTSSFELSEAINSMYQWYKNATSCYVYLHDTVGDSWTNRRDSPTVPKWFTRGWTLQELVAPKVVHFFDQRWEPIGDKTQLADILNEITRIPQYILKNEPDLERPGVAQIISWAANRTTTREEDRAYSLLGLLGVHMLLLLQLEIIRTSNLSTLAVAEDPPANFSE
ncbi:hypothetical protein F5J12DRAFT_810974 [Pisolithus orientalis]|uniref:uncharacterized protein n=1 Tax=Pisolithus orientalis TaxID=936130 RepID=UPI002224A1BA|nr:uncharacterized protein F5J12DRAFT_810974 [Pisolithus orientalis]KAI6025874.1 hypothetical protein F5J12DRAFT_810974 [Pisolithus orientalis]